LGKRAYPFSSSREGLMTPLSSTQYTPETTELPQAHTWSCSSRSLFLGVTQGFFYFLFACFFVRVTSGRRCRGTWTSQSEFSGHLPLDLIPLLRSPSWVAGDHRRRAVLHLLVYGWRSCFVRALGWSANIDLRCRSFSCMPLLFFYRFPFPGRFPVIRTVIK